MGLSRRDLDVLRSRLADAADADPGTLAELRDELRTSAEELRVVEEELRVRNEELLRARSAVEIERERYRDLFEFAPDAYLVTDAHGKILEANQPAVKLLNVRPRALPGKPLAAYIDSPDRFGFRSRMAHLASSQEPQEWEFRIAARKGALRDVAATVVGSRARDGTVALRWLLRDISARRRSDEEIRELAATLERRVHERTRELSVERDRLRLLFERLHEGVITFDRDLRVGFANHEVRAILGTSGLRAGDQLPDVWADESLRALARRLHEPDAAPIETVFDDGGRTLRVAGLPAAGLGEAVLVVTDVTEREQRERAERAFVTNAAHELQTPLTAISSAIEVLEDGAKDDPAQRDVFLAHIEREAGRLRRLVRALLTLARAQTGVEPLRRERIRAHALLEDVAGGLQPVAGVEVVVSCPSELTFLASRELTEQAVANLAGNAAKYTAIGRIALSARATHDGRVALEVADTGRGIAAADRARVFQRFYRGDLAGVHDWSGFGLGLPIVAETVKSLGGELEVESVPGQGTTVRVLLPAGDTTETT